MARRRASVPFFPRAFLPPFNEGIAGAGAAVQPRHLAGGGQPLGAWPRRLIAQVPEVIHVGRRTGRAELDEHAEGVHFGRDRRGPEASRARPRSEVDGATSAPGSSVLPAAVAIGQPISHRLDHMLSGVRAQIAIKIFGDDLDTLRGQAEQLRAAAGRACPASST